MNDLHTKRLLFYQRLFFSRLEEHVSKDWWVMVWNTGCGLFCMPFCVYLHTQLENVRLYKDALPNEWMLYYRRDLFSELELYVRYDRQVMDPNPHLNFFRTYTTFVHAYTCNLKTTGCMWMLYVSNNCSTIRWEIGFVSCVSKGSFP